jgi:hypothetical protein
MTSTDYHASTTFVIEEVVTLCWPRMAEGFRDAMPSTIRCSAVAEFERSTAGRCNAYSQCNRWERRSAPCRMKTLGTRVLAKQTSKIGFRLNWMPQRYFSRLKPPDLHVCWRGALQQPGGARRAYAE